MFDLAFNLPFIWAMLLAIAVLAYVILDGFDLGIGILFPFIKGEQNRDIMMNSVAPVWDGNETWLVLGGGGLFAAFPLAYSVLMPALYAPIIAMLIGLIFRGVAFEFRFKAKNKTGWDYGFALGSTLAAFCQGLALGSFIQTFDVAGRAYAGGWFDWATPFTILTGIAVICGYALLGATWLVMKTSGYLQNSFRRAVPGLTIVVVALICVVSIWTPVFDPQIADRWFNWPNIAYVSPVPILIALFTLGVFWSIRTRRDVAPFLFSLGFFILSYIGLGISLFPYIVPRSITIWEAAAPDSSLAFLLVGAVILLPIILAYTAYAYWVFRGKVDPEEGYH